MEQGLMHIYCGDGKGKTTCAFGLALRCAGTGARVRIAQFLKGGTTDEEILRAKQGTKFTFQMDEAEREQAKQDHMALLDRAFSDTQGLCMLVLDEIMAACSSGMVEEAHLLELIENRPEQLELVLTGRNPSPQLLALADYVTEMKKVRHPYDRGIAARSGIER